VSRLRERESSEDLDDPLARVQGANDFVKLRVDRAPQGVIADIADANPDHLRASRISSSKRTEVFVLGDQCRTGTNRTPPDVTVSGNSQIDAIDVLGPISAGRQLECEPGAAARRRGSGSSRRSYDAVLRRARGIEQRRCNIIRSEIIKVGQQLLLGSSMRESLHDVGDAHASALDARPTAANLRVGSCPIEEIAVSHIGGCLRVRKNLIE
jgi:hypothetical protein